MAKEIDPYQLAAENGEYIADPLGWVMWAFPWESDESIQLVELEEPYASMFPDFKYGPDKWACEFLDDWGKEIAKRGFDYKHAVKAIQMAVCSGHGIGKSTITAWIILFIMSTRPYCKGVVTSNTAPQLRTKTWAELGKWLKKCLTKDWFEYNNGQNNMTMYHKLHSESWRVDGQTCREENSESFAGLHAANSTPFYIFDEASAVPDIIHEVAQGGLTDGEPMMFAFGNGTKNTGRFREMFGSLKHRWNTRRIDSRSVKITNKEKIQEWLDDYGEDSDFFKVRVRGDFPDYGDMQFISSGAATEARKRTPHALAHQPLVMGVDVGASGSDKSVIRWRKGNDAKSIPALKFRGMDAMDLASEIARHANGSTHTSMQKADVVFVDVTGIGWGIVSRLRQLGINVVAVNFGGKSLREDCANKATQMWADMRDHLEADLAIEDDKELYDDLVSREYGYNKDNQFLLEKKSDMKKRGLDSPDDADALALTYAEPLAPIGESLVGTQSTGSDEFDPFQA